MSIDIDPTGETARTHADGILDTSSNESTTRNASALTSAILQSYIVHNANVGAERRTIW